MAGWPFHLGRTFQHARRYRHIMAVLMKYGFEEIAERLRGRLVPRYGARSVPRHVRPHKDGHTRPQRLRLALEELGPTFIKLGQLLSTRPDLVPQPYLDELSKLQDRVAPEKFHRIRTVIETEFGSPITKRFAAFDTEPLAAGSIAQVHRATLHDGRKVVLKVRRPDVKQNLATECEMLESLAHWLGAIHDDAGTIDLPRMVDEFVQAVSKEVDMLVEKRNLQRFERNFQDNPTVHVPTYVEDYCTEAILTMEYIDGVKPRSREVLRKSGFDPSLIAKRGADFVLRQIFQFGVFHSDPHPGNLLLTEHNIIVPLDFGQVARLNSSDRNLLSDLVLAIVDRDQEQIVTALQDADLLDNQTDLDQLNVDAEDLIDRYHSMPLKDIPLREVITSIFRLIRKHNLRPPAQFTLMLKSLMTIESLAMELDPQFDIIDALKPYARRFRMEQLDPRKILRRMRHNLRSGMRFASRLPEDTRAIIKKIRTGEFQLRVHHEHLEELTTTLDKSSNRISFAVIIAALLVASSLLAPQQGRVLGIVPLELLGVIGYCVAAVMGIWLLISILRSRHF